MSAHKPHRDEVENAEAVVDRLERATDAEFDAHPEAETSSVLSWGREYPRLHALTMVQGSVSGWLHVVREFGSVRRSLDDLLADERAKYPLAFGKGGAA
ncbi:hypothetical protein [Lysobacter antibioticus]|uniref:hypothetical protein n=1 Tax=Lysobacter antibioticus TaxID=84531 RepID=UPI0007E8D677|nr:hypothetical protein [Lysobacter antibioticus]